MISFFTNVDELITALQLMKEAAEGNCACGVRYKEQIADLGVLELVYINQKGEIVGLYSQDYQPKEDEVAAIKIL